MDDDPGQSVADLPIYRMPGHLIRRLNQISASVFQSGLKRAGYNMTSVQYAAMTAVAAHPGIDQATLAGLIAFDRATIGGVVDRLEQKGYLQRPVSEKDRRSRQLTLTDAGLSALETLTPLVRDIQFRILTGLTPEEQQQFVELAVKVAAAGNELSRAPLRPPATTSDRNGG